MVGWRGRRGLTTSRKRMHLGGVSARTDRPALCIFPAASAHFVQRQMAATAWQVWRMRPIYECMRTMDFKLLGGHEDAEGLVLAMTSHSGERWSAPSSG